MAGINLSAATPGLGRLALAIAGGPTSPYQRGVDAELGLQSKLAQALAASREHNAKADAEEQQMAARRPEAIRSTAMTANGIPADEAAAVDEWLRTGQLGGKYRALPPDQQGPTVPAPDWQAKLGDVARSIALTQRALTLGDKNSENVAKAGSIERGDRLSDAIINGTASRNMVAGAQAAAAGKPLYHTDTTGAVLDQFTGGLDTSNPLAGSTIGLRNEQAGQAKAGAAENYAQAGAARALEKQRNEQSARDAKGGDIIQVTQPDGTVLLVNKVTGLSRPAVGMDGKPIMKPTAADKPLPEAAQKQVVGARNVQEAARDYIAKLQNWSKMDMLNPNQRAAMGTAYNNLMLQAKEAYNLGVLNGPDYDILQSVVADPTKVRSAIIPNEALQNQARELQRIAGNIEAQVLRAHGKPAPESKPTAAAAPAAAPHKISSDAEYNALPSGAEFIAPDGSHRRKP